MAAHDCFRLRRIRNHALVARLGKRRVSSQVAVLWLLLDRKVRHDGVVVVEQVEARGLSAGHGWVLLRERLLLVGLLCLVVTLLLWLWPGLLELLEDLLDGVARLVLLGVLFLHMHISLELGPSGVLLCLFHDLSRLSMHLGLLRLKQLGVLGFLGADLLDRGGVLSLQAVHPALLLRILSGLGNQFRLLGLQFLFRSDGLLLALDRMLLDGLALRLEGGDLGLQRLELRLRNDLLVLLQVDRRLRETGVGLGVGCLGRLCRLLLRLRRRLRLVGPLEGPQGQPVER